MNDGSPNYLTVILSVVLAVMVLGIWAAMESAREAEITIRKAMECRQQQNERVK